jgi:hypothetical protein
MGGKREREREEGKGETGIRKIEKVRKTKMEGLLLLMNERKGKKKNKYSVSNYLSKECSTKRNKNGMTMRTNERKGELKGNKIK